MPPEPPETSLTSPDFESMTMTGQVDDNGLFPGRMKFVGDGGTPNAFVTLGELKSSISLLKIMPVLGDILMEPNLKGQRYYTASHKKESSSLHSTVLTGFLRP